MVEHGITHKEHKTKQSVYFISTVSHNPDYPCLVMMSPPFPPISHPTPSSLLLPIISIYPKYAFSYLIIVLIWGSLCFLLMFKKIAKFCKVFLSLTLPNS